MIKKFSIKKISKYTMLLLIVFLFYLFPKKDDYILETSVNKEIKVNYHDIFLLDKNNYISKTTIEVSSKNIDKLIDELIECMKIDGKYQDKIPNGFRPILPENTSIIDKKVENDIIYINFSKELFDVKTDMEEKVLESVLYTLTSIDGIKKINIKINGEVLKKLPKTGKIINEYLTRDFGINKIYNIENLNNITRVIIYYTSKTNNNDIYYVPVTKYINSNEDKIKIIIDELASKISYESNLMSYLNYNAKLLSYNFNDQELDLNFNEFLFDNNQNKKVLEEVIYSISYSIMDNYNVSKINFFVNNEEIK